MRMLLAGSWDWIQYEEACADALGRLGVTVTPFEWSSYFKGLVGRAQSKFPFPGPALIRLNLDFLRVGQECRPDVIFVWRGTHILPRTLKTLKKKTGSLLVSYNNDDPFGPEAHGNVPWHHHLYWRNYLKSVPFYDVHFVFRQINLQEIVHAGARAAHVLMPYFIPEIHRPVELTESEKARFGCDIVYVGHYEPDGREHYLRELVQAGLHVRLHGDRYWTREVLGNLADYFGHVRPVYGNEYATALCGAKMCLCVLSRINRDSYTTRCFEIPACGRLLLSERTDDLLRLFREDEEAVFFSSPSELVEKALYLRDRPDEIERIAAAGMRRVHADGHSVDDRMKTFLSQIGNPNMTQHLIKDSS